MAKERTWRAGTCLVKRSNSSPIISWPSWNYKQDEEDDEEKEEQKGDMEIETDDDDELEDEMMQGHDDWDT